MANHPLVEVVRQREVVGMGEVRGEHGDAPRATLRGELTDGDRSIERTRRGSAWATPAVRNMPPCANIRSSCTPSAASTCNAER